ncbi:MAG: peptide chain release factor N(5)-glutamine methyltransferase [Phycisphaerales bacterium]|nr:peptide chain release factor N(5)-glutamine methyltransferase [Phycisphaerales bacterium]
MSDEAWTTRRLRDWMRQWLRSRQVDSPHACVDLLLGFVLKQERVNLYTDSERPASAEELTQLRDLVARAGRHEPVQYLVGSCGFYTHTFEVNSSTLIPRPCTEALVAEAVRHLRSEPGDWRVLDIGTGTGCIAISIAAAFAPTRKTPSEVAPVPCSVRCVASDIAEDALQLAARNAQTNDAAELIEFRLGDLYGPCAGRNEESSFRVICSNPPYISDAQWVDVPANVRDWEPSRALRGGADGLRFVEPIIRESPQWLSLGGCLLVEIAFDQADAALAIAERTSGLRDAEVLRDDEGLDRVLRAFRQ